VLEAIDRDGRFEGAPVGHVEDGPEAVGVGLVRTKQPKVRSTLVFNEDVPHHLPELPSRLPCDCAGCRDIYGIITKIGYAERYEEATPIRVRIRPHAAITFRRELRKLRQ